MRIEPVRLTLLVDAVILLLVVAQQLHSIARRYGLVNVRQFVGYLRPSDPSHGGHDVRQVKPKRDC